MTILLIIVGYILNVILNRWISINIQKISSLDMLGMLTFWVFVPFFGTIILLIILLITLLIEKGDDLTDNKFFNWFKYTPILLLFVLGSCNEPASTNHVGNIRFRTEEPCQPIDIFIIDSCEYLVANGNIQTLTHKGNCKFCKQRNQIK